MIRIAYSGSLGSYDPRRRDKVVNSIYKWFGTYVNSTIDASTRSGYYLIQAVKRLKDVYNVNPDVLHIDWWGDINPGNMQQVSEEELNEYFTHTEYLPKQESLKKIRSADLLFLPLEKSSVHGQRTLFIPGKLYEYLSLGKPILALCEDSDCKDILRRSGLGIFAPPDDAEEIAKVLAGIINGDISLANFLPDKSYIEHFSFINKTGELAEVFGRCLR